MTGDPLLCLPQNLQAKVESLVKEYPATKAIIYEVIDHLRPEQKQKKIKLQDPGKCLTKFPEFSFTSPSRKKLQLCIHESWLSLQSNNTVEYLLEFQSVSKILCLSTPGKSKPNWSIVIIPQSDIGCILSPETIIFTFDEKIPQFKIETEWKLKGNPKDQIKAALLHVIDKCIETDADVFESSKNSKQSTRYVTAYHKAKDGFLYFLEDGVFFGFKKPIMFIDWKFIAEFGIHCVTGRTFDLAITMNDEMKNEVVEFAMIDQAEYDGVAQYINRFQTLKNPTINDAEDEQMGVEEDEEEDESYASGGESDDAVAEEYDSNHDSDGSEKSSISIHSDSEEEAESDQEEPPVSDAMKAQLKAIENQRKNRAMIPVLQSIPQDRNPELEGDEEDELDDD